MKNSVLKRALRISIDYLPKHPQLKCYPHYSFIVQDNKIIEWATNVVYEPPIHFGYRMRISGGRPKLHAEFLAYKRARGILGRRGFEVVNIRLNRSGMVRISKPCQCCHDFLSDLGCIKFWYSWEGGFLSCD